MAELKPIRTKADYEKALQLVETLWGAKSGTAKGDQLEVLATLIDAYETRHFPIDAPDPVAAIKFRMEQLGLTNKELARIIGSRGRISEILNRKRSLSIAMIRKLHSELQIPAEILISDPGRKAA